MWSDVVGQLLGTAIPRTKLLSGNGKWTELNHSRHFYTAYLIQPFTHTDDDAAFWGVSVLLKNNLTYRLEESTTCSTTAEEEQLLTCLSVRL